MSQQNSDGHLQDQGLSKVSGIILFFEWLLPPEAKFYQGHLEEMTALIPSNERFSKNILKKIETGTLRPKLRRIFLSAFLLAFISCSFPQG